jgi:hypothetical protein
VWGSRRIGGLSLIGESRRAKCGDPSPGSDRDSGPISGPIRSDHRTPAIGDDRGDGQSGMPTWIPASAGMTGGWAGREVWTGAACWRLKSAKQASGPESGSKLPQSIAGRGYIGLRVGHTLPFMYATHEHGQHLCSCVQSVACSGFLNGGTGTLACGGGLSLGHRQECLCHPRADSQWGPLAIPFYAGIIESCVNGRECFPIKSAWFPRRRGATRSWSRRFRVAFLTGARLKRQRKMPERRSNFISKTLPPIRKASPKITRTRPYSQLSFR